MFILRTASGKQCHTNNSRAAACGFGHVGSLSRQTSGIASSLEQAVSQLSGGNQQKVVFARASCQNPQVTEAPGPTRDVDLGAKKQLCALLRDLAGKGLEVVVVSDEEDEIAQLAKRVVIAFEGKLVGNCAANTR